MGKNVKGATLAGYGILAGLIAVVSVGAISEFGKEARDVLESTAVAMRDGVGASSSPSGSAGAEGGGAADPSCYSSENVGTVGTAGMTGCEGMLIVSTAMLKAAGSSWAVGDDTYQITTGDGTFTFEDDAMNIFTGQVTDIVQLFHFSDFNGDIGYWDTSSVTNMGEAFNSARYFNHDLSAWDTSSVINMEWMFTYATEFEGDISGWDVSSVITFEGMFSNTGMFNGDISAWDTGSAVNMFAMFSSAWNFGQNLSSWDVANVTNHADFSNNSYMTAGDLPAFP